ncbi:hypothetical protein [Acidovorax sp. Root217]|uniref:DUF6891 domain-containing protein n=1 Tax=Acidovorax sp. Root217 TaxID=1736492 RepID=UPI00070D5336|nr:hypothetical protein [Acidovorax sp. Root217]KRC17472.1 hypothetical protein ASE31_30100 [Acidovorax sp. Root217]
MPLPPDILTEIDAFVRGGFEDRERTIEILTEEMYEPGELDAAEVERAVDDAVRAHDQAKKGWPATTDCDRLDAAFDALARQGLVALQNAGYTQSDGYGDVTEAYHNAPDRADIVGYCFYHGQDLARAVHGGGLFLAFGPMDADTEETEGPRIGALIASELQRAGLEVRWNGSFKQRICIPGIDWKRR